MIKSFIFENFKSFEKAELSLESVTSLIGSNSSGKSNAVEGIQILAELATGVDLSIVLDGTRNNDSHIRGGSAACCRFKTTSFKLGCLIDLDDQYDLLYYIRISTSKRVWVEEEGLYKVENGKPLLPVEKKYSKRKLFLLKIVRIYGQNIMIRKQEEIQILSVCVYPLFWHS